MKNYINGGLYGVQMQQDTVLFLLNLNNMKYIIVLIFTLITIKSSAQECKTDIIELDSYELTNTKFNILIDSLIAVASRCDYYSDSLLFSIRTYEEEGSTGIYYVKVEAFYNKKYIITLSPIGFINYKNHDFFLFVENNDKLFTYCNKPKVKLTIKSPIYKGLVFDRGLRLNYMVYNFDGENFKFLGGTPYKCPD